MNKKPNQKGKPSKVAKKKARSRTLIIIIILSLVIVNLVLFTNNQEKDEWNVDYRGVILYPADRGKVDVKLLNTGSDNNDIIETISFKSKDYTVEGILRIPRAHKKVPAIVILPGASVPKEGTQTLARLFSEQGYASLGIEQRNRGGVNFEYDLRLFLDKKEPVEHKMVFDALRAVDVLKHDNRIDEDRIAMVGESNGGRFAIIAAAIETSIRGVIGISTSGYNTEAEIEHIDDIETRKFYFSIDPETYLKQFPPRKFVMIHSVNDDIIPIGLAESTYNKAFNPKQFYNVTTGAHGFSDGMKAPLENELREMFR